MNYVCSPHVCNGQTRSIGDVGPVSRLPESGHGWVIYECTPLIASVGLAESVLHGPAVLASIPGPESTGPIVPYDGGAVAAIIRWGRRCVARTRSRRRRRRRGGNPQFDAQRGVGVGCTPIDQRRLDLLPRDSAGITLDIVEHIVARRRTIQLCHDNRRRRRWRRRFGGQLGRKSCRYPRDQLKGRTCQCVANGGRKIGAGRVTIACPGPLAGVGLARRHRDRDRSSCDPFRCRCHGKITACQG